MMDIYIMQYNYQSRCLVVINENTLVSVYKYGKHKFNQLVLCFQAKHIFIGKSKICEMTEFSGVNDSSDFDGVTVLLEVEDKKYVYNSGLEISELKTTDKIIEYISLMANNMIPYTFAIGEKYTDFIYNS